jgi:hypothetical protein
MAAGLLIELDGYKELDEMLKSEGIDISGSN